MNLFPPPPPLWDVTGDWLGADVLARLFARRQVLLHGALDDQRAVQAAAQLMTLEAEGSDPITVHIHSSGGPLPALFTVADTVAAMSAPVGTFCAGQASGTAAALLALGTGTRRAAPNAALELRLPAIEVSGAGRDVERAAQMQAALRDALIEALAAATGQPRAGLAADWERGRFMTAREALDQGFIDEVGSSGAGERPGA